MRKETLLAAAALLALTAPAGAACLDQVAQLEQRLAQLESGTAGTQQQATATGAQQQQQPQQQPAPAAPQQQAAAPQQQQPATAQQGQATATQQQPIAGTQQQQPAAADTQQQPAAEETVEVTLEGGQEVEVTAEPPGGEGQSQDTWLGGTSTPSLQGVQAQLDGARTAAEEGNEAGCLEQVEQAERIVSGLEQQ
jgi:hypothetical protein